MEEEFQERQQESLKELQDKAKEQGFALLRTPSGLAFAPLRDDEVLQPEEFQKLPQDEQERIQQQVEALQKELQQALQQVPRWEREFRSRLTALQQEVAGFVLTDLMEELYQKYEALEQVAEYLHAVERDVSENLEDLLQSSDQSSDGPESALARRSRGASPALRRYQVNVLVDASGTDGAPVVYENNPSYFNLVGRVEQMAMMGALLTDFTLIKPGALHRANGGYLLLDALKLLSNPGAWEGLKRALRYREIRIESPLQMMSLTSTVSLEPEPIELDTKVILMGDRQLYYLLAQADPEFNDLFKVAADFDDQFVRDEETTSKYAHLIASMVREEDLLPFERRAVCRVIEFAAREVADAERVTARMQTVADLLKEADYWARTENADRVTQTHVEQALEAQVYRSDRVSQRMLESMVRETILVDTEGSAVGQINGLSVFQLGNVAFGKPTRITATVRMGRGEVVDIEREVELSGPLHSKGVLILSSFLMARYTRDEPLSLSASLVFEQSYGGVDGDSASSTELYALLSAISSVPIKQSFAVTGSVNQNGHVQAIGGVNEKIEGFFELCKARGLTGEQGVLIPSANVKHLMLRRDVVEAAQEGKFRIFSVDTIDQGIEILTGVPAGERGDDGEYPEGSINRLVDEQLAEFAKKRKEFGKTEDESSDAEGV
jgi:lon-related putative ATP-dependent protease